MSSNDKICFFCNKGFFNLKTFSCSHKICTLCLYERIFTNHIQELQGQNELKIKCKCENGYLNQNLAQIFDIFKEKSEINRKELEENNSENSQKIIEGCECTAEENVKIGKKFSEFFCLDCMKFICKNCKNDIKNPHLKHRILNSNNLIKIMKDNIRNIDLKYKTLDDFQERYEHLSESFENIIGSNFNNTILKLDNLIECAKNLKNYYIKKYKEDLGLYLKTFKYLKIFYLNYYKDKNNELRISENKNNNIYKLKYLNNISYEFIDMKINHSPLFDKELSRLIKYMEKLQNPQSENKFIVGQFIFEKIKKGFKMVEQLQAHTKFINALIVTNNNNNIITASNDYFMKVWNPNNPKIPIQQEKEKIMSLYSLKNGKILASKDNNILIFELKKNNLYELSQSLTNHDKNIFALSELDDGTIVSGSLDKKIIFWEEDPENKLYKVKQIITTEKEVQIILALNDFKIAYAGNDDRIINILGTETELPNEEKVKKIKSKEYFEICKLEKIKGKVNCMCKLNQGYFVSGGGDIFSEKRMDHNIYIWKPNGNQYNISQIIHNAHEGDVNSIILLRDGRFASSSKDRTIKIWEIFHKKVDNKIKFVLNQNLQEFKHGLYKMVQLDDDRIVATSSDNYLVFWANTDGIL